MPLFLSLGMSAAAQAAPFRGAAARTTPSQAALRRVAAASVSVHRLGRTLGLLQDTTVYEVKGISAHDLGRALKAGRFRDSAGGAVSKFHEHDIDDTTSVALARPLQVPTAIVMKIDEGYYGGGFFGPVWGYVAVERIEDSVFVNDVILGSPIYRAGHHLFVDGARAITRAIEREMGKRADR